MGPKPTQKTSTLDGDKGEKSKNKNIDRHCNFCGKDGHDESKCFKKMATLEEVMKNHNINIDSTTSSSSSHGYALFSPSMQLLLLLLMSGFFYSGASYHMAKEKAIFSTLNECNTKKIFVGDDRSLSVVGSGTVQVDNGHFNDVLCVRSLSCNLL
jgi:hypothetical protein